MWKEMSKGEGLVESVLFEEGASLFHNFIAVGGTLRLTDKRIVFRSCQSQNYEHEISVELCKVSGVEFFKTMFINPNGLAVMLNDGSIEHFVVDDRKAWSERILQLVGLNA